MDQILERLRKNDPTLTSLDICSFYLRSEGVKYLADALRVNNTLTFLDISWYNLEPEEEEKTIKYLVECNSVYQQLEKLGKVVIKDEKMRRLINSLFFSFSIGKFSLPNELRYEIAKEFILELKENVK